MRYLLIWILQLGEDYGKYEYLKGSHSLIEFVPFLRTAHTQGQLGEVPCDYNSECDCECDMAKAMHMHCSHHGAHIYLHDRLSG